MNRTSELHIMKSIDLYLIWFGVVRKTNDREFNQVRIRVPFIFAPLYSHGVFFKVLLGSITGRV